MPFSCPPAWVFWKSRNAKDKLSFEAEGGRSAVFIYKFSLFISGDLGGSW